jgi:hypothetical protein
MVGSEHIYHYLFLRVKQWGKSPLQFLLIIKKNKGEVVQDVHRITKEKEKRRKKKKI